MHGMHRLILVTLIVALLSIGAFKLASAQGTIYVVQPGDSLDTIGLRYGITAECIMAVNALPDLNLIYVGQRLIISACQPGGTPGSPVTPAQPVQPVAPTTYTVQPGETIWEIAQEFDLDADCLARANSIVNPNTIRSGQVLNLGTCQQGGPGVIASVYEVRAGDRLVDIAARFAVDAGCLVRVNALADANRLVPGTRLQIDPCIEQGGGAAPLPTGNTYTVQPGDRLNNIAATLGVNAACVARTNQIANADFLIVGETLVIDYVRCGVGTSG